MRRLLKILPYTNLTIHDGHPLKNLTFILKGWHGIRTRAAVLGRQRNKSLHQRGMCCNREEVYPIKTSWKSWGAVRLHKLAIIIVSVSVWIKYEVCFYLFIYLFIYLFFFIFIYIYIYICNDNDQNGWEKSIPKVISGL